MRNALSGLTLFFSLTIFTSAALLFFVQPMYARLVLPLLGGSAAVWTVAMLFFQVALLVGYLYAHLSTRYLKVSQQVALHLLLWALAIFYLPLAIPQNWQYDAAQPATLQALQIFALGVGAPFAILAGNAPLIQSWYARSGAPLADDPYFLYGASNFGSLLALLGFPLIAAPLMGASDISIGWAAIYLVLGALLLGCGIAAARGKSAKTQSTAPTPKTPLTARQIGLWLFLAFIPSSMMLATTETIATDIGSFPLIWVIPLALYLLTFILAFSNRSFPTTNLLERLFILVLIVMVLLIAFAQVARLGWLSFGTLIIGFFITATLAHRKLYMARPQESHLTIFYFTMSVGGALGGVFNSLIAPAIFTDVYEGPIIIALSALLILQRSQKPSLRQISIGVIAAGAAILPAYLHKTGVYDAPQMVPLFISGAIIALAFSSMRNNGIGLFAACAILCSTTLIAPQIPTLHKSRSFFGTYKVRENAKIRSLLHGTTVHGAQLLEDIGKRPRPISYYHKNGPMGQLFLSDTGQNAQNVGVVGLGVGALACYIKPNQNWTFFEIDPIVDQVARDPDLFDFMDKCAGDHPTLIGDARLVLERSDAKYDILVIDAYSSDSVPVHLITKEAVAIYKQRLTKDGILAFHISNRFFDLAPVLARVGKDLGLSALEQSHPFDKSIPLELGDTPTRLVIMSQSDSSLQSFTTQPRWSELQSDGNPVWSDDFSNALDALY